MIKGSKHSEETRARLRVAHSPNGTCKRGHLRTPENIDKNRCCKLCKLDIGNKWRKDHPILTSENTRRSNRIKSEKIGKRIQEYKNTHPCVDCGESDLVVLSLDHRDPSTKKFRIRQARSWVQLESELAKCDVRCYNCHARRHAAHGWKFGDKK